MKNSVSVVIPTYNGLGLLETNLPILFSAMSDGDEVLIVDDASTDETVIFLLDRFGLEKSTSKLNLELPINYFPRITQSTIEVYESQVSIKDKKIHICLIINKSNQRFAASANVGVAMAQHDWVFLLNNDVKVDSDCLNNLKSVIKKDKDIFAVGCIEYSDKKQTDPSGKNKLWFEKGSGVFSREKWLRLAGFDLHFYPAYWEDIDISYRARQRGWKVLFEPSAIVYHRHETTNANVLGLKKIAAMSWRHAQYFTWKHTTFSQKIQFLLWLPYWTVKRFLVGLN